MDACSIAEVLQCEHLSDCDSHRGSDVPVARYADAECAAVLWVSRSEPREQTVEVVDREADAYGDVIVSASTDWSPPPAVALEESWLSGFLVTAALPSGERAAFTTGVLGANTDVVTVGSSNVRVEGRDQRDGAFVVRLPRGSEWLP